jgi:RNA polymerase sigma-70 factor (ECF subfamily)
MTAMSPEGRVDSGTFHAFQRGDHAAVRTIVRAYSGMVTAVAHQVLHNGSLAEEAAQQTFVQAWRGAATLDPERGIAPWLCTIARRVAIDIARREHRRAAVPLDDIERSDRSLVTLPPSETASWEMAQVRLAIDALPPDERDVVRLQHLDGLTHQEIADRLGIALGTVKSRSFRAHRSLAGRLAFLREESA